MDKPYNSDSAYFSLYSKSIKYSPEIYFIDSDKKFTFLKLILQIELVLILVLTHFSLCRLGFLVKLFVS